MNVRYHVVGVEFSYMYVYWLGLLPPSLLMVVCGESPAVAAWIPEYSLYGFIAMTALSKAPEH